MCRTLKTVICVALLLGLLCSSAFAEDKDVPQYMQAKSAVPGYLLAILLGFGIGHYYIETDGTAFLVGELTGLAIGALSMVMAAMSAFELKLEATLLWSVFASVSFGVYGVFRVVEIVGIFIESDVQRRAGVVAGLEPVVDLGPERVAAGVRLRSTLACRLRSCSVSAAWCFADERNPYVDCVLETSRQSVAACRSILPLARRQALSSYDAAYLDIAMKNGIPPATQGKSLRQACYKNGVTIFRLDQD